MYYLVVGIILFNVIAALVEIFGTDNTFAYRNSTALKRAVAQLGARQ